MKDILNKIKILTKEAIFPHLPVDSLAAQKIMEINILVEKQSEYIDRSTEEISELKALCEEMAEALGFYADDSTHTLIHGAMASYSPVDVDEGYRAKRALEKYNKMTGEK